MSGLGGLAAGLLRARATGAQSPCPPDQVERRRVGCVCQQTGRPPGPDGCRCRRGLTACAGACVDLDRDPRHCRACDNACDGATPFCAAGRCVACRSSFDCDDGIACTTDRCAPDDPSSDARGCVNLADDAVCADGNPCTINTCQAGTGCVTTNDGGAACDTGDPSEVGACQSGDCKVAGPTCPITLNDPGPPARIEVSFQDSDCGLAELLVTRSENADTVVPPSPWGPPTR